MMKRSTILMLIILSACSGRPTINLNDQEFAEKAKHIIWIQIPGLSWEHLAFLKMDKSSAESPIAFEQMNCLGAMWSFNLKELRPNFYNGFNSQFLGSKNIDGTCNDLDRNSVWSYYEKVGYSPALYEVEVKGQKKFQELSECPGPFNPFRNVISWIQGERPSPKEKTFHFQENFKQRAPGVYYDKSCSGSECFSNLNDNLRALWPSYSKTFPKTFLIIRDGTFLKLLKERKYLAAKKKLRELDKLIDFFIQSSDVSLVISSSEARGLEFPAAGRAWKEYQQRGKNLLYKRSQLVIPVWAKGPGTENFCGMYEESEIFKRFLWAPEKNILDLIF